MGANPKGSSRSLLTVQDVESIVEKQINSRLDVRKNTDIVYYSAYNFMRELIAGADKAPPRGSPSRDIYLAEVWKDEPILAGAVYSMVAKMTALKWSITGAKRLSVKFARIMAGAAHNAGEDWGGFISSTAEDYYTVNRGVFWEVNRDSAGWMNGIGHIDALCCELTGNAKYPMHYSSSLTGQNLKFKPDWFIHFDSMVSPREKNLGTGFCAVDRALRAAKLLMGLHDYDDEKLSNLPPEGVATVTGLTMDEFNDAVALWKAQRQRDNSLTFPQVLWLIGSDPSANVAVSFQGFSQVPESFDRKEVVTQYISTLALCFGVDAREFWPISSGSLGTASESEIQHLKAKGKGPGEFISTTERHINAELPEGTDFKFDTQDIEEDSIAASVAKAWIEAYLPLTQLTKSSSGGGKIPDPKQEKQVPLANKPKPKDGEEDTQSEDPAAPPPDPLITGEMFLRLLADKGVIPDYLVNDDRVTIADNSIHISKEESDDPVVVEYNPKNGIMEMKRLPPIVMYSRPVQVSMGADDLPEFLYEYKDSVRNIHGNPIPDRESRRGSRITNTTIQSELQLWRNNPELKPFAPSEDEESEIQFPDDAKKNGSSNGRK